MSDYTTARPAPAPGFDWDRFERFVSILEAKKTLGKYDTNGAEHVYRLK